MSESDQERRDGRNEAEVNLESTSSPTTPSLAHPTENEATGGALVQPGLSAELGGRRLLSLVVAAALVAGLATSPAPAGADKTEPSIRKELAAVRRATAHYHDVDRAERDGYVAITGCISSPGVGSMGIHYANAALMDDGVVDPKRPEILLYMPTGKGQGRRLVGVEYWLRDADQNLATAEDRPSAFGQPFDGPMAGHVPGMPVHFDLHVWVWKSNPAGVFESYNPNLRCPEAAPSGSTR